MSKQIPSINAPGALGPIASVCRRAGLVAELGADTVQAIIAQQFRQRLRYEPAA